MEEPQGGPGRARRASATPVFALGLFTSPTASDGAYSLPGRTPPSSTDRKQCNVQSASLNCSFQRHCVAREGSVKPPRFAGSQRSLQEKSHSAASPGRAPPPRPHHRPTPPSLHFHTQGQQGSPQTFKIKRPIPSSARVWSRPNVPRARFCPPAEPPRGTSSTFFFSWIQWLRDKFPIYPPSYLSLLSFSCHPGGLFRPRMALGSGRHRTPSGPHTASPRAPAVLSGGPLSQPWALPAEPGLRSGPSPPPGQASPPPRVPSHCAPHPLPRAAYRPGRQVRGPPHPAAWEAGLRGSS